MALTSKQRAKQLESLLDAVERGNKRDAIDYTGGHLNESNLRKPAEFSAHKGWEGANKGKVSFQQPSKLPKANQGQKSKRRDMSDILTDFTMGNDGFLPNVKPSKIKHRDPSDSIDDRAWIEEIDSRRFMLNKSQPPRMHKSWAIEDENSTPRSKARSVPPKHEFYSLKTGATKQDQFRDFASFENRTIRKKETMIHNVLSAEQAVFPLEQRLNRVCYAKIPTD